MGSAYVNAYDSHPRLHIRNERNRRYNDYSYVNAVCREPKPTQEELRHAYHVAGDSFVGKLKEYFLILDDDHAKKASNAGGQSKAAKAAKGNKAGKGKRHASGEPGDEAKKRVPSTQ